MNSSGRFPIWIVIPAVGAVALVSIPLLALGIDLDWGSFVDLVTSPSSLAALSLSLKTATASTVACLILGVPLAIVFARGRSRMIMWARPLMLLPLVMPPVVGGMALLSTFGRHGLLGQHLEALGVQVPFSTFAVVIAQTFVSLPFLVVSLEGALRSTGEKYEHVAATLGAGPTTVLRRVTLPLVLPGLVAGSILAFARALGEFGATITFAGSLEGVTRTMPLEIYLQRETDPQAAVALSIVLVVIAAVVMFSVRGVRSPWS